MELLTLYAPESIHLLPWCYRQDSISLTSVPPWTRHLNTNFSAVATPPKLRFMKLPDTVDHLVSRAIALTQGQSLKEIRGAVFTI